MNKKCITYMLLLFFGLPYGWLAIWWDGLGSLSYESALLFYVIHWVVYTALTVIAARINNLKIIPLGYLLSMLTSRIMTMIVVVTDMNHFYTPLTYETVVYWPYVPAFLISGLATVVLTLINSVFNQKK